MRRKSRLVPDMEADQADGFLDASRAGLGAGSGRVLSAGEIDQRVPGVELIDQILVLLAIQDAIRHLEHDRAHPAGFGIGTCARIVSDRKHSLLGELLLTLLAEQLLRQDVVEHRLVHQNVEQRDNCRPDRSAGRS